MHCFGSRGQALQGAPGSAFEIQVPVGVTVRTDFGTVIGTALFSLYLYDI